MKHIKALFLILLISWLGGFLLGKAFACRNQVPESEAIRYHEAAKLGQGVPALYTCEDKPDEECLCFDHCEGWDVCKVELEDFPLLGLNGEVIGTAKRKVLVNNVELVQARRTKEDVEANHREIAKGKKEQARVKLSDFDESKNYTAAQLKTFIKALIEKD